MEFMQLIAITRPNAYCSVINDEVKRYKICTQGTYASFAQEAKPPCGSLHNPRTQSVCAFRTLISFPSLHILIVLSADPVNKIEHHIAQVIVVFGVGIPVTIKSFSKTKTAHTFALCPSSIWTVSQVVLDHTLAFLCFLVRKCVEHITSHGYIPVPWSRNNSITIYIQSTNITAVPKHKVFGVLLGDT